MIVLHFVQLLAATLAVYLLQLESQAFFHLCALACVGLPIHAALPSSQRTPFFVALSMVGLLVVAGPIAGLAIIGLGGGLFALCHVPAPMGVRVVLVVAAGAGLAASRARLAPDILSPPAWAILSAMFMFRTVLYLHALRHRDEGTVAERLAYFFLLPNPCFPLFPVVDYSVFLKSKTEDPQARHRGFVYITRGIVHLTIYRAVYYHGLIAPHEVTDLTDVLRFVIGTFALYTRVSGHFHIVIGMLGLFGFSLPRTHDVYFLATSVSDFFRRANVYWRDQLEKLIFLPSYLWLRRRARPIALVASTALVFLFSWLLHAYQWFWLRGEWVLVAKGAVFWGAFGVVASVEAVVRNARGRKPALTQKWSLQKGLQTLATMTFVLLTWSYWSADSFEAWSQAMAGATNVSGPDLVVLAVVVGLIVGLGGTRLSEMERDAQRSAERKSPALRGMAPTVVLVVLMLFTSIPVAKRLPAPLDRYLTSLSVNRLNYYDAVLARRGYYEQIDPGNTMSSRLWEVLPPLEAPVHDDEDADDANEDFLGGWPSRRPFRLTGDWLEFELRPNQSVTYRRQPFITNKWGLRDDPVRKDPPQGSFRIAALGSSVVMGWGVRHEDTFASVLERELANVGRVEVLNFGTDSYTLLHQRVQLESKVLSFSPDLVMIFVHAGEVEGVGEHLLRLRLAGTRIENEALSSLVERAGSTDNAEKLGLSLERRAPRATHLLFSQIAQLSRSIGAPAVVVQLYSETAPDPKLLKRARREGLPALDLGAILDDHPRKEVVIAPWDPHPTAKGHQIIGERLAQEIRLRAPRLGWTKTSSVPRWVE